MAEADVFVLPSLWEGLPLSLVLAMGAGVAVVSTTVAGIPEVVDDGRTGFLVPPNDPNELTHAILAALFKPELGQAKTSAAKQTNSKFRPRQRLRALTPFYESLHK